MTPPSPTRSLARKLFLAMVALLPLQTLFIRVEVAWKPWLVLVVVIVVVDVWESRGFGWSFRATVGAGLFLVTVLVSWPGAAAGASFWRLFLALVAGVLLMLVVGRHAKPLDDVLRVVFWSGAVMATTAFILGLVTSGAFGDVLADRINDLPLVERVNKPAYLGSGFVALTNWHQDPGYSALWTNVWMATSIVAWARGAVKAPRWVPPLVVGGLGLATILTYSRTGWAGLALAVLAALYVAWRGAAEQLRRALLVAVWGLGTGLALLGIQVLADPAGVGGDISTSIDFRLGYLFALGQIDLGEVGVTDPSLIVDDNRIAVWSEYFDRFAEHPLRGIGLGTGWGQIGLQEPHNLGVQLLAEVGVIGFLGFLVLMLSLGSVDDPLPGALLLLVLFAGIAQTVLFEAVLWYTFGLWLASSRPLRGFRRWRADSRLRVRAPMRS